MPDYKRLVSYMYNYEDGAKKNNVGYARVETRNGQCKYTIHITAPSLNEKQLKVYLFKRNAEDLEGILLGNFQIRNGIGDFKTITEASQIKGTSYGLEDVGGVVLYYTERKFFATEWDSKPVLMTKVFAMDKRELKKVEERNAKSIQDVKAATVAEAAKETVAVPVEEVENVIYFKKDESKNKEQETSIEEPLNDLLTPNLMKVIDNANTQLEEDLLSKELLDNNKDILKNNENSAKEPFTQRVINKDKDKIDESAPIEQKEEENNPVERSTEDIKEAAPVVFEDHDLAKQIYKSFPRMYPFEDNEIAWCARIEPKDIGMLPTDFWGLGNNSFLLHGYYSYRHIIFARTNDKNGYSYILGVPGIYHNREKFMAKMFGFEKFKCTKRKPQRTGEFGYWYIPIVLN